MFVPVRFISENTKDISIKCYNGGGGTHWNMLEESNFGSWQSNITFTSLETETDIASILQKTAHRKTNLQSL